jgi:four helix bundle protein
MSRREEAVKQSFRDLLVWQKAMTLVTQVYGVTKSFRREELYGLTSQIRRAAVSVPSNIAEGQARPTRGEFRQFLGHAKGSLAELETQLLIAENLGFFREPNNLSCQVAEVGRMLSGLMTSLALDRI